MDGGSSSSSPRLALERALSRNGGRSHYTIDEEGQRVEIDTPDYFLLACWMHCRRGFIKAAKTDERAEIALDLIGELYGVEDEAAELAEQNAGHNPTPDALVAALLERRRQLRQAKSRDIIERLAAWRRGTRTVKGTALHDAVQWMDGGWTHLIRFLDLPLAPVDNGPAERAVRGLVVGRKVFAGSRSERGVRVAELLYSLVETCKLEDIDARAYLIEAANRAIQDRRSVFLPEDYAAIIREKAGQA